MKTLDKHARIVRARVPQRGCYPSFTTKFVIEAIEASVQAHGTRTVTYRPVTDARGSVRTYKSTATAKRQAQKMGYIVVRNAYGRTL